MGGAKALSLAIQNLRPVPTKNEMKVGQQPHLPPSLGGDGVAEGKNIEHPIQTPKTKKHNHQLPPPSPITPRMKTKGAKVTKTQTTKNKNTILKFIEKFNNMEEKNSTTLEERKLAEKENLAKEETKLNKEEKLEEKVITKEKEKQNTITRTKTSIIASPKLKPLPKINTARKGTQPKLVLKGGVVKLKKFLELKANVGGTPITNTVSESTSYKARTLSKGKTIETEKVKGDECNTGDQENITL